MATFDEESISGWEWVCYYEKSRLNPLNNSKIVTDTGKFVPSSDGLYLLGKKITVVNSSLHLVEENVIAFKFDFSRIDIRTFPSLKSEFRLNLSFIVANDGKSSITVYIKPFANYNFLDWTEDSDLSFNNICNSYTPFGLSEYSNIYGDNETVSTSAGSVTLDNVGWCFYKFIRNKTIGFQLSLENGYAEVFGPDYGILYLRPRFSISQLVDRQINYFYADCEIRGLSKVKGVCRNKDGVIITGSACSVVIFDLDSSKILGTGNSSLIDGSFLIDTNAKVGDSVLATFSNSVQSIYGAEIMTTVSYNTV